MNKNDYMIGAKVLLLILVVCNSIPALGLEPNEIMVVANRRMDGSVELAHYYMDRRLVPKTNFLSLSLTLSEIMTREEYDNVLKKKVLERLEKLGQKDRIEAIVLFYGVPLKVEPPSPTLDDLQSIKELNKNKEGKEDERASELGRLRKTNMRAAVDSELSLVLAGQYELDGWVKNPYFLGFQHTDGLLQKNQVILVSRLDGPDIDTVYRIINDSLEAERKGLQGTAYFDARWPMSKEKQLSGYRLYDQSLHKAAAKVKKRMPVVVDEQNELFPVKSCPGAALYCGWYSLAKYVDSFIWEKGAIAYHIASAECDSLRNKKRSLWCLKMLEKGVAATIGPVYEPYVQGFPVPEIFFGLIVEGYMSLGESYLVSLPFLSWQTILIGDPLYQPFSPEAR
jgi:uncharacterized protein (TIGR03790 family)